MLQSTNNNAESDNEENSDNEAQAGGCKINTNGINKSKSEPMKARKDVVVSNSNSKMIHQDGRKNRESNSQSDSSSSGKTVAKESGRNEYKNVSKEGSKGAQDNDNSTSNGKKPRTKTYDKHHQKDKNLKKFGGFV